MRKKISPSGKIEHHRTDLPFSLRGLEVGVLPVCVCFQTAKRKAPTMRYSPPYGKPHIALFLAALAGTATRCPAGGDAPLSSSSGGSQITGKLRSPDAPWWQALLAKIAGGTCPFSGRSLGREGPSIPPGGGQGISLRYQGGQ